MLPVSVPTRHRRLARQLGMTMRKGEMFAHILARRLCRAACDAPQIDYLGHFVQFARRFGTQRTRVSGRECRKIANSCRTELTGQLYYIFISAVSVDTMRQTKCNM